MIRKDVLAEKVLEVISVDTGWSLTKTPNDVFVTGIKKITSIPAIYSAVLEYEGKYYKIGTNRLEVTDSKTDDKNCFLLILVAVAKELKRRGKNEANVFLALGLPLTRFGAEKKKLIDYVSREGIIEFSYEQESYKIEIKGAAVFPQCYAAVADKIPCFTKKTIIVDIGSWTIDIMPVVNKAPDELVLVYKCGQEKLNNL